jgi:hypothetical protein
LEAEGLSSADFHPDASFFESLPARFGSEHLDVSVAGITSRLMGLSAEQKAQLAARYGIFSRARQGAEIDLTVDVRRSPRDGFLRIPGGTEPETYRLLTRFEDAHLLAWSYEWASSIEFEERKAILVAATEERVVFDRIVENFLRVAFAHLVLAKGGLLMHAAGVVKGGRAYVFFGPSGSGKTTTTVMSAGSLILSDDLLMIVRDGEAFRASSVPFRGLVAPPATTDERYPIGGLYRLVKDDSDFLEDLGRPQAVGQVVQSLPFVTDRAESAPRILDVVSDLAAAVAVRKLHFRKDPGFWRVIRDVGGSAAEAS